MRLWLKSLFRGLTPLEEAERHNKHLRVRIEGGEKGYNLAFYAKLYPFWGPPATGRWWCIYREALAAVGLDDQELNRLAERRVEELRMKHRNATFRLDDYDRNRLLGQNYTWP